MHTIIYCALDEHLKTMLSVLIVTARHKTFSGQRVGLCNPVSIWAVITTEQIPTGHASKHTMYCTLSVSSAVLQSMWVKVHIKLMVIYYA